MKAIILAAGRGERMRPLTDVMPKPLLQLGGRPIIEWTIARLARAGIVEIVINHAHLGHLIEDALGDGGRMGVSIRYSPEGEALETAGGIAKALDLLGNEPFIAVNGDIFCEFDFAPLSRRTLGRTEAHIVLVPNPDHHPEGDFALTGSSVSSDGAPRWTFSGIGLYRPALFDTVPRGQKAKLAPLLRAAMTRGLVTGEVAECLWLDIGTPGRLDDAQRGIAFRHS